MTLRVIAAAIRHNDVVIMVPRPRSHHGPAISLLHWKFGGHDHAEEGFVLSDGTFASRAQAYHIAKRAGQYRVHAGPDAYYAGPQIKELLFSEDLWDITREP